VYKLSFWICLIIALAFSYRYALVDKHFNEVPMAFGIAGTVYCGLGAVALQKLNTKKPTTNVLTAKDLARARLICVSTEALRIAFKGMGAITFVIVAKESYTRYFNHTFWVIVLIVETLLTINMLSSALAPAKKNWMLYEEFVKDCYSTPRCPICSGKDWRFRMFDLECRACGAKFHEGEFLFRKGFEVIQKGEIK